MHGQVVIMLVLLARLVGIMLQILIIILFRISSKKLSKCFYYSQVPLIMFKIIPRFYNFFNFYNQNNTAVAILKQYKLSSYIVRCLVAVIIAYSPIVLLE